MTPPTQTLQNAFCLSSLRWNLRIRQRTSRIYEVTASLAANRGPISYLLHTSVMWNLQITYTGNGLFLFF